MDQVQARTRAGERRPLARFRQSHSPLGAPFPSRFDEADRVCELRALMVVLSVDLASRRYRDIGIAILRATSTGPEIEFLATGALGLVGTPKADQLAEMLSATATSIGASLILLDGPQGWKSPNSDDPVMRRCERLTRTPGKTGLPGMVKPASWTRMVTFSVSVFDELHRLGWPRFDRQWARGRSAIESFPTQAWRTLGLPCLPGKKRRGLVTEAWWDRLRRFTGLRASEEPSHDELQAAVAGLAGLNLLLSGLDACEVAGDTPSMHSGTWFEGFIVSPRAISWIRAC